MIAAHTLPARARAQRGAFSASFAILLVPIIGVIGMAIDLSLAYARRTEMQGVADAAAMAAAHALDGTMTGVATAKTNAANIARANRYNFITDVEWNNDALRLSTAPDAPEAEWVSADSVSAANVATMRFAKVDTADLSPAHGRTSALFAGVLGVGTTLTTSARAVAGRTSIQVTPLAICALRAAAASARPNTLGAGNEELLEYGFRRGVNYNLLNLNPGGTAPANYLINPIDFPPAEGHPNHHSDAALGPFVCNGTLATPSLGAGDQVYVRSPFPAALTAQINSRFEMYQAVGGCSTALAPPDANIRNYTQGYAGWWMPSTPAPSRGSALEQVVGGNLLTLGESPTVVAGTNASSYGPLWSFSKPVRYNPAMPGSAGTVFLAADWNALYPVAVGSLTSNYSNAANSPYKFQGIHRLAPVSTGLVNRRVLNVPLLACPVAGGTATVLAIGRFLMTSPATTAPAAVHAEFGGLTRDATLGVSTGVYQ